MSRPEEGSSVPVSVSDRLITTLAIIKVNHDRDQTLLGNYLPFVYHCLFEMDVEFVSTPELKATLDRNFGIKLPQSVVKQILKRACDEGKLSRKNDVYIVERDRLRGCNLTATRDWVQRGYHELIDQLVEFASEHYQTSWSIQRAGSLVSAYVDGFSSGVLATALAGKPPPAAPGSPSQDEYVIHRFVAHIHERDQQLFGFLETVVKGRMLADALYFETEGTTKPRMLAGLEVYLDGPLLLHILGYGGTGLQAPYREFLDMLKRQDVNLRCFSHSVSEAQEILEAAAKQALTGNAAERYYGDVVSYLVRSSMSRSEIELASQRLQQDLLQAGIQTVDAPDRGRPLQLNEERLKAKLAEQIPYKKGGLALTRDLDSLTAIYRLREGRSFRDISECQAIFVTGNYDLFRASFSFFEPRSQARTVPVCVYHMSFTVLVWLRESRIKPNLARERIIADTYAALNPPETLWHMYNKEIERLKASDKITEDDVHYLRFADEALESLMDITRGDASVFTEGTLEQVLERSREAAQTELREELARAQRERDAATEIVAGSHGRLTKISRTVALTGSTIVVVCFAAILMIGAYTSVFDVIERKFTPDPIQGTCFGILVFVGLWSVVHSKSLTKAPAAITRTIETGTAGGLRWVMQLPPLPVAAEESSAENP